MSTVIDGKPAGTSPAPGSMAALYKEQMAAPAKDTPEPERPGSEPASEPSSATPEKVETAPASEHREDVEQEPEYFGTPEQQRAQKHAFGLQRKARRTAETRAIKAEARIELLEQQIAEIKQRPTAAAPVTEKKPAVGRPKLIDYTSQVGDAKTYESLEDAIDAHAEALSDWKHDQREKERQTKDSEREAKDAETQHLATQSERVEASREKYEDFDDVAFSERLPLNQTALNFVMRREHGYDVLYYLGQNLKEAKRIVALDPDDTIVELRAIETKVSKTPVVKTETSAPVPPRQVGGKAAASVDPAQAAWDRGDRKEYKRLMDERDLDRRKARGL